MKINEIIKRLVAPISGINKIIPKKNIILFYSNQGFRDNIRALYDYIVSNNYLDRYKVVCALGDSINYKELETKDIKIVGRITGIFWFLRSKYVFYCFDKYPIMPSKKQMVVHMWHGMPMKRIGNLEERNKGNKYDYFTYIMATSEFFKPIMSKAFNVDENRVLICGEPKTDALGTNKDIKTILRIDRKYKMIIWMPTYRVSDSLNDKIVTSDTNGIPIIDTHEKLKELNKVLSENRTVLFIKLHPVQNVTDIVRCKYSNIIFINDERIRKEELSLYEFISGADAMISDYSSSYMQFLLLNRPICFAVDDIGEYGKTRGFVFEDPTQIMPGRIAFTKEDIYMFIKELNQGIDEYREEREKTNKLLNMYSDFNNSRRLLEMCGMRE